MEKARKKIKERSAEMDKDMTITIHGKTDGFKKDLDEMLEKANRLNELLREAQNIINSLSCGD